MPSSARQSSSTLPGGAARAGAGARMMAPVLATRGAGLAFLPGGICAKVNPYPRPLFDALSGMREPEAIKRYMDNDIIEIVPLAYMRGRAQPLSSKVLTPEGFRPIGSLGIGDEVIGSDGRPTRVEGVYLRG